MAVTQISKIQLRRGAQQELDSDALDEGEFGFATDTGRLFIGAGGDWTVRSILPEDVIEVLTERSTDTLTKIMNRVHRTIGPSGVLGQNQFPFIEADLEPEQDEWVPIQIYQFDGDGLLDEASSTDEFILVTGASSVAAQIIYTVTNSDGDVVRSGTMNIIHDGNSAIDEAVISDEHVADFQIASSGTPILIDELFVTGLRFRAYRLGTSPSSYFRMEYMNDTNETYRIQMRSIVAAKPEV